MTALTGGFADAPRDAAHAFRAAMGAMARPGTIHDIAGALPPAPLSVAAGTLLLTLCDPDTPVYLAPGHDTPDLRRWITFHTGAPFVAAEECSFAIGLWDALLPLSAYKVGTPEYPDGAATLIIEMPELLAQGARLQGPGIRTQAWLNLPDPASFAANAKLFPLGFDAFFAAGAQVAALPRSTQVTGQS